MNGKEVLIIEGYAARLYVERAHLVAVTGFPTDMREIRFPRGRCEINRIIIRANGGTVSIPAFDWCMRMGISLAFVASDSTLTNCVVPEHPHDGPLKRIQAVAGVTAEAFALGQWLLERKIQSQIKTIKNDFAQLKIGNEVSRRKAAEQLQTCIAAIPQDDSLVKLLTHEAFAAKVYWELLAGTALDWPDWCFKRIPGHWAFISPRDSGGRASVRDASDPFNAILNYCYTLLEVETRIACAAVGLDPDLGLLHVDTRLRESFIYDLLEPLRAPTDVFAFEHIRKIGLRPHMFHELRNGIVRLDPDLAKDLTESIMPKLRKLARNEAEEYAKKLRQIKLPYKLVRYERQSIAQRTDRTGLANCKYCNEPLQKKGYKFCGRPCFLKYSVEIAKPIEKAQAKLAEMRAVGLSPGHGGEAAKIRGAKIAASNRRRAMQLTPDERRVRRSAMARAHVPAGMTREEWNAIKAARMREYRKNRKIREAT